MYTVDCSNAPIANNYSYVYYMLLPAYEGVMMSMECASGYEWDVSPYTGSRVANCTNNTGTGQWSIADSATCVRMFEY